MKTEQETFTRELRYIIVKCSDANKYLSPQERSQLETLSSKCQLGRIDHGKELLTCVVVESDWPEFEPTWKAIEARVCPTPAQLAATPITAGIMCWRKLNDALGTKEKVFVEKVYKGGNCQVANDTSYFQCDVKDLERIVPVEPAATPRETAAQVPTNYPWLETAHFLPDSPDTMLLAWVRGDHVTYRTGRYIDGEFIGSNRNSFRTAPNYFREVTGLFNQPDEGDKLRAERDAARREVEGLKAELAQQKIAADFWLAHEKNQNVDFEKDYLAIWKAVKQPDMTVLDSVLALRSDLTAARQQAERYREVTLKQDAQNAALRQQAETDKATIAELKQCLTRMLGFMHTPFRSDGESFGLALSMDNAVECAKHTRTMLETAEIQLTQREKEAEGMRRDSERLDWIIKKDAQLISDEGCGDGPSKWGISWPCGNRNDRTYNTICHDGHDLRTAIDVAMSRAALAPTTGGKA